ncbi:MAG TPA: nucleoside-diphosphate sugar epimerase/dehydratase [Anaerolineae bacterium]|nr:nucleoside-diphosphate sugar epimerase/dehydratase [Anaerolineae bacterium]HQK12337.1 nucleoside-diphosphate sugar epimerase/dehydratase [Anaerolineae bacterium]
MKTQNKNPVGLRVRYLLWIDLLCIILSIVFSFVIRYEALLRVWPYLKRNWILFVLIPLVRLPLYYVFRLYRRLWRYASIQEFKTILLSGASGSLLIYLANFGLLPLLGIPYCPSRSIWALEGGASIALLGATRLLLRLWQARITPQDAARLKVLIQNPRRVLIAGAGDAGAMILREVQNNPRIGLNVVGFVDDNPNKLHMHIYGIQVLGTRDDIPALAKKMRIDEVIIAMPTAPGKEIRAIKGICEAAHVSYKTVPGVYELIDGSVSVNQLREVQIEDLLRRNVVTLGTEGMAYLRDAVVMVTGAGGSIGSELCRQIAAQRPRCLVLLDQGESAVYYIDLELRRRFPSLEIAPVIADIRDPARLERVMARYTPEIIFHAAAYKHVPLMELNPEEAILNNVQGSRNLLQVAERYNVRRFVLISTDKAVHPSNFMGASKRIVELLVQDAARRSGRNFVAVRFGNVLGSEGSVVPLFKQQIAAGGPVTVTHPDMTRYFMTIPEAVQLVIQAAVLGKGGEIFVLDMGEPVKIVDLARDLITLSGLQPDRDIEIVFTGLRPGEKLEESLFNKTESYTLTAHEKIFVVTEKMPIESQALQWGVQKLIRMAQDGDVENLWASIQAIVPECQRLPGDKGPLIIQEKIASVCGGAVSAALEASA